MIIKVIYGIFMFIMGAGIIKYRRNVKGWTGNFVWAEHYIGNGGTYLILIGSGLVLMFYGITYPFR